MFASRAVVAGKHDASVQCRVFIQVQFNFHANETGMTEKNRGEVAGREWLRSRWPWF